MHLLPLDNRVNIIVGSLPATAPGSAQSEVRLQYSYLTTFLALTPVPL